MDVCRQSINNSLNGPEVISTCSITATFVSYVVEMPEKWAGRFFGPSYRAGGKTGKTK